MAVPISGAKLSDVTSELSLGSTASLQDCFDNASPVEFNYTYGDGPYGTKSLKVFRDYDNTRTATSLSLAYDLTSTTDACSVNTPTTYYADTLSLSSATKLWANSSGTTLATSGYYSDQSFYRFWDGSDFTGSAVSC